MSKATTTNGARLLANSRAIRFYQDNDEAITRLHSRVNRATGLTMEKLYRDAVDAGLPIVEDRLKGIH